MAGSDGSGMDGREGWQGGTGLGGMAWNQQKILIQEKHKSGLKSFHRIQRKKFDAFYGEVLCE